MTFIWERIWGVFRRRDGIQRLREENYIENDSAEPSRSSTLDYTELMGGTVPCPSCKGTGRIPKEMEEQLVALIPINDERLQPKHTWRLVALVILACVLIATGVVYMLVPRAVELHPINTPIDHVNIIPSPPDQHPNISFHFLNAVNVWNANYYSVQVTNTSATVINKFLAWSKDVIGSGINSTRTTVLPLTTGSQGRNITFNNTVTLFGSTAEYCQASFSRLTALYVNMQFDVVVTLLYFNHREQITLSTVQQVCCVPSGNCTNS